MLALKLVGFRGFTGTTRVILQQSLQVRRPSSTTLGQVPHDGKSLNISTTWETDACLKSPCSLGFRINPAPQQCVHCLQNKSRSFAKNEKYRTWPSCEVQISCSKWHQILYTLGFPGGWVKNLPATTGDAGSIPGPGRSPGGGNGNPRQCSCLGNPTDRGTRLGYSPQGRKVMTHDLATKQQHYTYHA